MDGCKSAKVSTNLCSNNVVETQLDNSFVFQHYDTTSSNARAIQGAPLVQCKRRKKGLREMNAAGMRARAWRKKKGGGNIFIKMNRFYKSTERGSRGLMNCHAVNKRCIMVHRKCFRKLPIIQKFFPFSR
jgi:hypothetical protein